MRRGRLIAVVGPSGVGKDSVMQAMAERATGLALVRRTITRPAEAGGEVHEQATEDAFRQLEADGAFALSWAAHGHRYGIRHAGLAPLAAGQDCLVNLSRGVLERAAQVARPLVVLAMTARPETLAARLAARGRETPDAIRDRLARPAETWPENLDIVQIANDGALADTVDAALHALGLSSDRHILCATTAPKRMAGPATDPR